MNKNILSKKITRRDFFKVAFGLLTGFITLLFGWPLTSFLIGSGSKNKKDNFVKVPNFAAVPTGTPTKLTFQYIEEEAFLRRNVFYDVWVLKTSPKEAKIYSPFCTHLSCRYDWKSNDHVFACARDGQGIGGSGRFKSHREEYNFFIRIFLGNFHRFKWRVQNT